MAKILTEIINDIFIVSINRPEVKNAIDGEAADLLYEAFTEFEKNNDLKVAILTATGNVFCSGADLKSIAEEKDGAPQLTVNGRAPLGISRLRVSKPTIAAVEGYAVAGGLELALWCDMRVAAADAIFGVYCRRFGVPLVDGGTIRLPRLIGQSHAMDLILTGRGVSGQEAKGMGLTNRVTPSGEALDEAMKLAKKLCAFPQVCMNSDRMSVLEQWSLEEDEALKNEAIRGMEVLASGETLSGAKRFTDGSFS